LAMIARYRPSEGYYFDMHNKRRTD